MAGGPTRDLVALTAHAGPIAALDPRTRIVLAGVVAVVVVTLQTLTALVLAVALAAVVAIAARLPWRPTRRMLLTMDGFVLAMLVLLPFTTPGRTIIELGPFQATAEGLHLALAIALKANAIVLTLLALVGSIEPARLGHTLHRLGVPLALAQLLLFTVRYIDVLKLEYLKLRTAMRARAFEAGLNRHTLTTFGYLVGMLLVRASERSERVLKAMRCRGFDGRFRVLSSTSLARPDAIGAAVAALGVSLLVVTEHVLVRPA